MANYVFCSRKFTTHWNAAAVPKLLLRVDWYEIDALIKLAQGYLDEESQVVSVGEIYWGSAAVIVEFVRHKGRQDLPLSLSGDLNQLTVDGSRLQLLFWWNYCLLYFF